MALPFSCADVRERIGIKEKSGLAALAARQAVE
jgi:hypothetical protein